MSKETKRTHQLFTLILPRIEWCFVREWCLYHHGLGFDRIHIYDNGPRSVDTSIWKKGYRELKPGEVGKKWTKKPDAEYFEDLTDEEIQERLRAEIADLDFVTLTSYAYEDHYIPYPRSQISGFRDAVEEYGTGGNDWWACIDVDEFLRPNEGCLHAHLDRLQHEHPEAGSFLWKQRVFEGRDPDKLTTDLVKWAYNAKLPKSITKAPLEWLSRSVHTRMSLSDLQKYHRVKFERGYYAHYRGKPELNGPNGGVHMKFKGLPFVHKDDSVRRLAQKLIPGYPSLNTP